MLCWAFCNDIPLKDASWKFCQTSHFKDYASTHLNVYLLPANILPRVDFDLLRKKWVWNFETIYFYILKSCQIFFPDGFLKVTDVTHLYMKHPLREKRIYDFIKIFQYMLGIRTSRKLTNDVIRLSSPYKKTHLECFRGGITNVTHTADIPAVPCKVVDYRKVLRSWCGSKRVAIHNKHVYELFVHYFLRKRISIIYVFCQCKT